MGKASRHQAAIKDVLTALVLLARLMDRNEPKASIAAEVLKAAEITLSHRGTLNGSPDGRYCLDKAYTFLEAAADSLADADLRGQVDDLRHGGLA